jgi:hypothetical protein
MKPSTVPILCGAALAVMSAAGLSHWWSVRSIVSAVDAGLPVYQPAQPLPPEPAVLPPAKATEPRLVAKPTRDTPPADDANQKKFYEALISKMENLQNQNRDLLNQVAETNRDMMNLNFRVDTFSDSFRPMPVSEDRPDMSLEDGPGVLPPRAEPVFLPYDE